MASRRGVLATLGVAGALGALVALDRPTGGTPTGSPSLRSTRLEAYRPVVGGTAVTVAESDGTGTLAGGLEGADGEPLAATNRHVVDPDYPDSDDADVLGTAVYQPDEDRAAIGEVVEVGPAKGSDASDWALIELADADDWSGHILGLGPATERDEAADGDRITLSGIATGLHGGEITNTAIDRNWRGTLLNDVVEYRVDDDADTAGNSGAWVGYIDAAGAFRPIGLHTFADSGYRYAVPISDVLDATGATLAGNDDRPAAPDTESYVEGAIGPVENETATVAVANVGGESVSDRTVQVLDGDGEAMDSTTVDLDPLETARLELDAPERPTLSTGDERTEVIDVEE